MIHTFNTISLKSILFPRTLHGRMLLLMSLLLGALIIDQHYMADGFHTGFLNPRGIHRAECPECVEGSFPDNGSAGRIKKQKFSTDTALC